jgi:two-component system phosphate regulon sensor histidine kinase PhoR
MGLAMIGLISFQLYWVQSMLSANEERFKKDVIDALNSVASKLEKQETIAAIQKLNYLNKPIFKANPKRIKTTESLTKTTKPKNLYQSISVADTIQLNENVQFIINFSSESGSFASSPFLIEQSFQEELLLKDYEIQELEQQLEKLSRKYELTFDLVNDLLLPGRTLMSRFNPDQLDSLSSSFSLASRLFKTTNLPRCGAITP